MEHLACTFKPTVTYMRDANSFVNIEAPIQEFVNQRSRRQIPIGHCCRDDVE